MLAPIPIPRREASIDADATHLEIRLGSGRVVSYPMASDEFLIGGATGCDLRLSGSNVPPVVCQFTQSDDGLRVRKLAPNATVLLNGTDERGRVQPVLTWQQYGRGKAVALTLQDTWQWQMHASISLEDQTHENYWRKKKIKRQVWHCSDQNAGFQK